MNYISMNLSQSLKMLADILTVLKLCYNVPFEDSFMVYSQKSNLTTLLCQVIGPTLHFHTKHLMVSCLDHSQPHLSTFNLKQVFLLSKKTPLFKNIPCACKHWTP